MMKLSSLALAQSIAGIGGTGQTRQPVRPLIPRGLHVTPSFKHPLMWGDTLRVTDLSDRDLLQVVSGNMGECSPEFRFLRTLMGLVTEGGGADPQVQQRTGTNFLVTRQQEVAHGNLMGDPDAILARAIPGYDPKNAIHAAIRTTLIKRQESGDLLGARFRDLVRIPTIWDLNAHGAGDMEALLEEAIINSTKDAYGDTIPGACYTAKFFSSQNWMHDISIALDISARLKAKYGDAFTIELAISFSQQPHYPATLYTELFKKYVLLAQEKGLASTTQVSFKDMVGSATEAFLVDQVVKPCLDWLKAEGITIAGMAHHMHETDNAEEVATRREQGLAPRATIASAQFALAIEESGLLGGLVGNVQLDGIFGGDGPIFPSIAEYQSIFEAHGQDLGLTETDKAILGHLHALGNAHLEGIDPAIAPIISAIQGKDLRELDVPGGAISSTVSALSAVKAKLVAMADTLGAGSPHTVPMDILMQISALKSDATLGESERDLEITKVALNFFFGELKELQADFGFPWKVTPGYQHCMILGISRCMDKIAGNPVYTTLPDGTAQFFASGPFPGTIRSDILARCCSVRIRNNLPKICNDMEPGVRERVTAILMENPVDKEACGIALQDAQLGIDETIITKLLSIVGPGKGQYEGTKDTVSPILTPLRLALGSLHCALEADLRAIGVKNPYLFIEVFGVNAIGAKAYLVEMGVSEDDSAPILTALEAAHEGCFPDGTPPLLQKIFDIQATRKYALEFTLSQALASSIVGTGWEDALLRPRAQFGAIWAPDPSQFAVRGGGSADKHDAKQRFRAAVMAAENRRTGADKAPAQKVEVIDFRKLMHGVNQIGNFDWVDEALTDSYEASTDSYEPATLRASRVLGYSTIDLTTRRLVHAQAHSQTERARSSAAPRVVRAVNRGVTTPTQRALRWAAPRLTYLKGKL